MKTFLSTFRSGTEILYTVYNSRGQVAIITRSAVNAQLLAESFRKNPQHLQVTVGESDPDIAKRR